MNFRPCIDIHNGKVKQIVGGSLADKGNSASENFVSDCGADFYARLYKEKGLKGGHIIILNAAEYIENGASHIIVTSYVFKDGNVNFDNLDKLIKAVGKEHIVLDLSCRKKGDDYYVVTDRWQKFTDMKLSPVVFDRLSSYCDEFLVHAVDVEGKARGVEEKLAEMLGEWGKITLTYAGGIGSFDDLDTLKRLGKGKLNFTVGSALDIFGGTMDFEKVVQYH